MENPASGRPVRAWCHWSGLVGVLWLAVAVAADGAASETTRPAARSHPQHRAVVGVASVYAKLLDGRKTASGETHDSDELVAAHRTLPMGSEVRVTNLANRRSVVVRINDRGPAVKSRIIDLSPRAASEIGLRARGKGLARVRLDVLREGEPGVLSASAEAPPGRDGEAKPVSGTAPSAGTH